MKRIWSVIVLLAAAITLGAQNNPYEVDDDCYALFKEAELLEGKTGFDQANAALLSMAVEKNDPKAQTLYYVERLKHAIALLQNKEATTQKELDDAAKALNDAVAALQKPLDKAALEKAIEDAKAIQED